MLAAMIDGLAESGATGGAGATGVRRSEAPTRSRPATRTAPTWPRVLSIMEMCWGDVGLLLSMPRQGLGNSAIASVANDEQLERFAGTWAAMAITEPERRLGLRQHQDHRGQGRRRVRPQRREDLRHLRRARRQRRRLGDARQEPGRAAIKSFVVQKGTPGHAGRAARAQARDPGLRHRRDHLRGLPGAGGEPARLARGRPQAGFRRRDGDLRQHPPAGGRDGGRLRQGVARPDPRPPGRGRRRGRLRPAGDHPVGGGRDVPADGEPTGRRRTC